MDRFDNTAHTDYRDDLRKAVSTLRSGGIILYPTDTVWGIGCDATNPKAVAKIYALKQREECKSMLVLLSSADEMPKYSDSVPEVAFQLSELSERPCTLVLDDAYNLASNLIAPDGSVGMRVSRDSFSNDLCRAFRKPIVSTSANISGHPSAPVFSMIEPEIVGGVDYVVKWRQEDETVNRPSMVIRLRAGGEFSILRD